MRRESGTSTLTAPHLSPRSCVPTENTLQKQGWRILIVQFQRHSSVSLYCSSTGRGYRQVHGSSFGFCQTKTTQTSKLVECVYHHVVSLENTLKRILFLSCSRNGSSSLTTLRQQCRDQQGHLQNWMESCLDVTYRSEAALPVRWGGRCPTAQKETIPEPFSSEPSTAYFQSAAALLRHAIAFKYKYVSSRQINLRSRAKHETPRRPAPRADPVSQWPRRTRNK